MPKPRKQLISIADTPYYHCVSRCVRQTFLCGHDPITGQSYEYRRDWVEKRLLFLSLIVRQDKRGSIDLFFTPILQRFNIPSVNWLTNATQFEQYTLAAVNTEIILSNYYQNAGYKRRSKISKAKQLLA